MHPRGPAAGERDPRGGDAQSRHPSRRGPRGDAGRREGRLSLYEKKGWFRLDVPEGWEREEEEDGTLALSRLDGPGALQLTVQEAPRGGKAGQRVDPYLLLRAFAAQTGVDFELSSPRRWTSGPLDWASCEWTAEEQGEGTVAWRAWMATNQDLLAFATYARGEEERDRERAAVDALLAGLELF